MELPGRLADSREGFADPSPPTVGRRQLLTASAVLARRALAAGTSRPNILLIVSEDNGPQFGCYGDRTVPTPHLDALAAAGTRWETAYVTQAVCSPSRSSMLTGLYPHQNGQIGLATHAFRMVRNWPNIPGLLKEVGYRTGLLGKLHVNPEPAFPFDFRWADAQAISFNHRNVAQTADVAGEFFLRGGPFFLQVSFADAHLPFLRQQQGLPVQPVFGGQVRMFPAVGADSARLRDRAADYYNCISRLDTGIGMLLARLKDAGRDEDTLVVYVGDHGPQFSRGKGTAYEFALRVPLVMRWPGQVRAGEVRREMVSTIDLLPTLAAAAGAQIPARLPGRKLAPQSQRGRERTEMFCEWNTSHSVPGPGLFFPQRTVRDRRYKLIVNLLAGRRSPAELYYTSQALVDTGTNQAEIAAAPVRVQAAYATWRQPPRVELYDLERDPHEFENLAGRRELAKVESRLLARLTQWQQQTADPLADAQKLALLDAENEEVARRREGSRSSGFQWRYPEYLYGAKRP